VELVKHQEHEDHKLNCIRNIVSPDVGSALSTHLDDFNSKEEYLGEIANDIANSDYQVVFLDNDD
jgi:hypothetical protein